MKNLLVACEESQRVCIAFRERGWNAFSCDLQECSGGHPEWHIQGDVLRLINGDCEFETTDGQKHTIDGEWDLIIAHPPCTYLTVTGNRWFNVEKYGAKAIEREREREKRAQNFSCALLTLNAIISPLRTLWAVCLHVTANLIKLFSHIGSEIERRRRLVYG